MVLVYCNSFISTVVLQVLIRKNKKKVRNCFKANMISFNVKVIIEMCGAWIPYVNLCMKKYPSIMLWGCFHRFNVFYEESMIDFWSIFVVIHGCYVFYKLYILRIKETDTKKTWPKTILMSIIAFKRQFQ